MVVSAGHGSPERRTHGIVRLGVPIDEAIYGYNEVTDGILSLNDGVDRVSAFCVLAHVLAPWVAAAHSSSVISTPSR